jgi:hypothetical protein
VLDPDVAARLDDPLVVHTGMPVEIHGATVVAEQVVGRTQAFRACRAALVDG